MTLQLEQEISGSKTSATLKKVAVVGATGYTGQELIRLLLGHAGVELHAAVSGSSGGKSFAGIYPSFQKTTDLICSHENLDELAETVDLIFLALPHGHAAQKINPNILQKSKLIDLSADFRLKDKTQYDEWYKYQHPHSELLSEAVYGLPELHRAQIKDANLVANPGCYATCSILTLAPLIKAGVIDPSSIIIDAKSGVSGAGRSATLGTHYNEVNESIKAYSIAGHRHTPEIEQELGACASKPFQTSFTPHLVPMNRGILVTAYANLISNITNEDLDQIYNSSYGDEGFIRVYNGDGEYKYPETRFVKGSNFCDIGATIDTRTGRVIAVGALDNLIKGAAGQAIQNMNIMFGWQENEGLKQLPLFPA